MGDVVQLFPQRPPREEAPPPPSRSRPAYRLAAIMSGAIRTDRPTDGAWIIHGHRFTCGMPFNLGG